MRPRLTFLARKATNSFHYREMEKHKNEWGKHVERQKNYPFFKSQPFLNHSQMSLILTTVLFVILYPYFQQPFRKRNSGISTNSDIFNHGNMAHSDGRYKPNYTLLEPKWINHHK